MDWIHMLFVILVNLHVYFDSLNENQCFAVFHVTNADGYSNQILLGIKEYLCWWIQQPNNSWTEYICCLNPLVNLHVYFDSLNENQCFAVFHVTNADGYIDQILLGIKDYSLHTRKECRFGQDLGQTLAI